jgi:hypothetical protein
MQDAQRRGVWRAWIVIEDRVHSLHWPLTPALSPEYRGEGVKTF